MSDTTLSRVDRLLANVRTPVARRGNLIFALDATASRERTWDSANQLTAQMFREVATIGTLSMQLGYYRGLRDMGGECRFSRWVDDPMALANVMSKITCVAGETQIERVLDHVAKESLQRKINALVFVGDCCEEGRDVLAEGMARLAQLNIPAFMFQEGADFYAQKIFQEIAQVTKGAYRRFDQGSLTQLAELLRLVSVFAVGGVAALEQQGSSAAKLLLGQIGRR
jgi:hypothetical protein